MQPTTRIRPDDDRGYARAVKQVVGAFEASLGDADPVLAGYVAELMLHYRWAHGDGRILWWTAADVEGFLLDLAPDEAEIEDEDVSRLPGAMLKVLEWLAKTQQLGGSPIAVLSKTLRTTIPDYLRAMEERGPAAGDEDADDADDGPMPAISLPPVPELAAMAESTVVFARLRAVRDLLETPRRLTKAGTLVDPDVRALGADLGLADRIADVDRLVRWAVLAGFGEVERTRLELGPNAALFEESPQEAWLLAMLMLLNGKLLDGEPGWSDAEAPLKELVEQLPEQLYPDGTATLEQLETVAVRLLEEELALEPGSKVGRDLRRSIVQAVPTRVVEPLVELGMLAFEDGSVALTTLGRWGLMAWMRARGIDAPVTGDLVDASAADVLTWCHERDQEDAEAELLTWIAKRPVTAANEIAIAARAGAPVSEVMFAFELIGPWAEPAVRDLMDDPRLAGAALIWLVDMELVAPDDLSADEMLAYLTETLLEVLDDEGPEEMAAHMALQGPIEEQLRLVDALGDAANPRTNELLNAIGAHHPMKAVAKQARSMAFKRQGSQVH